MDYDELVRDLREQAEHYCKHCSEKSGEHMCGYKGDQYCGPRALLDAADAIEQLEKKVTEWQEEACKWNTKYYAEYACMPQWSSVKEQLPEDGVYVLARYKNNDMVVACVFEHDECLDFWRAMTDEGWCADCDTEPTHWMPLPTPPKEEP